MPCATSKRQKCCYQNGRAWQGRLLGDIHGGPQFCCTLQDAMKVFVTWKSRRSAGTFNAFVRQLFRSHRWIPGRFHMPRSACLDMLATVHEIADRECGPMLEANAGCLVSDAGALGGWYRVSQKFVLGRVAWRHVLSCVNKRHGECGIGCLAERKSDTSS